MNHSKLGIASILLAIGVWIYLTALSLIVWRTTYFSDFFEKYISGNRNGMVNGMSDLGLAVFYLFLIV